MEIKNHTYIHAFNLIPGVGPQTLRGLAAYFPSYQEAWHASASELERSGITARAHTAITLNRSKIIPEQEYEKIIKANNTQEAIEARRGR